MNASAVRCAVQVAVLAAVYVAAAKVGLLLATVGAQVTLVWPPTGLALATMLLGGSRLWPGLLLGATLVNASTGVPVATACGMGLGNTLEALIGANLLHRFGFQPSLERLRDVVALVTLAAGLSTIVSATVGVSSLVLGSVIPPTAIPRAWGTWWLGDALGDVVVAPALLVWTARPWRRMDRQRNAEALVLLVAVVLASVVVFGDWFETQSGSLSLAYLAFPFALWATLRFGPPGAAVFTSVVSSIAIWGAAHETGPFIQGTILRANLLNTQAFMGVVGITALLLAAAAAERTRLLTQEQAARRVAEAAVQARDEFLSVAAHELKTPLTSLRGFAQLLLPVVTGERGIETPSVHRAVQHIDKQSAKLDGLVTQLLDLSRIEAGKLVLEKRPSDMTELVEAVAAAAQAGTSHHTLVVDAPGPIVAVVDPLRVEQVVVNLVNNAIKYSPNGGSIDITVGQHSQTVQVTVRDHGLGIPPEHRAHIFDRFYQAHAHSYRSGMGLGLYVSRQIVDLHDGSITAAFPADAGTTFVVTLPTGYDETHGPVPLEESYAGIQAETNPGY